MNRRRVALPLICVAIAVSLGGCAGNGASRQQDIAALRGQIDELRRAQEANGQAMSKLSEDVKALNAQSAFLVSEAKGIRAELTRVAPIVDEDHALVQSLGASVEELRKSVAAAPAPASANVTAEKMYAAAMARFQVDDYRQALLGWAELMQRFPDDPLAANAQYWIGETYYRQRDFRAALPEFRRVVDGYAKSQQVPEALLKIGLCYRALMDATRAREAWEQLAANYPTTNAAGQARALLAASGASAPARP
jgi:tol-pal system protein YbgF